MEAETLAALRDAIQQSEFRLFDRQAWTSRRYQLIDDFSLLLAGGAQERKVLVAIAGATGTGKSTLLNGLAGAQVSPTGIRRPTTSEPIVWHQPPVAEVLKGRAKYVEGEDDLLEALTLVDAPDFDSTLTAHREVVETLLRTADLCVFVASAKRYSDDAAWEMLHLADRRALPVYFVLNRLPEDGWPEIVDDYSKQLRTHHLFTRAEGPRILLVAEQEVTGECLSSDSVAPLRRYLEGLRRVEIKRQLLMKVHNGRMRFVASEAEALAEAIETEATTVKSLEEAAQAAFSVARRYLAEALAAGSASEELESTLIGLGESAAAATLLAWSSAGVSDAETSDHGELEEKARKAVADFEGRRPDERSPEQLLPVLQQEEARLVDLARSLGPPDHLASRIRGLTGQLLAYA